MDEIRKIKSITLWIFIVPFFALNVCLILITQFHDLFPNQQDVILNTIPYIDGGASISRTARVFPTYLIFKPAMFLTSFLLIKYWIYNNRIISNLDPEKILDSVDDLYRSNASHGIITLSVTTVNWQRTLTLEQWSKGEDKSLIKILKPKKEKGLATLRVDKNVWNYLPKVKRVVKIPSSMMSSSWMGSHFTNDDLVKQSRMTEDYTFSITFEGTREGKDIIEITCIPNKDAAVVWGKVEVIVFRDDYIPIRMIYYDEDLLLSRTLEFTDIRTMNGKMIPTLMSMIPADEPDESTTVRWEEIQFDVSIDDEFFSLRKLQQ